MYGSILDKIKVVNDTIAERTKRIEDIKLELKDMRQKMREADEKKKQEAAEAQEKLNKTTAENAEKMSNLEEAEEAGASGAPVAVCNILFFNNNNMYKKINK